MKVFAQVQKYDDETGTAVWPAIVDQLEGEGETYEEAKSRISIPAGWKLCGWIVPEHLDRGIETR